MDSVEAKLRNARIARLATVDAEGRPHVVPVCFAHHGKTFYTAVDLKPKQVPPQKLARLRNIRRTPQVALLIDHYDENWTKLWFILVRGRAKLIPKSANRERAEAIRALKIKYRQYAAGMLPDDAPLIRITAERIISWGKI